MFGAENLGRWLIVAGLLIAAMGVGFVVLSKLGLPLGRLPGDFRFQGQNVTCLIPLASSILLSLLLTLALNVIVRLLK